MPDNSARVDPKFVAHLPQWSAVCGISASGRSRRPSVAPLPRRSGLARPKTRARGTPCPRGLRDAGRGHPAPPAPGSVSDSRMLSVRKSLRFSGGCPRPRPASDSRAQPGAAHCSSSNGRVVRRAGRRGVRGRCAATGRPEPAPERAGGGRGIRQESERGTDRAI